MIALAIGLDLVWKWIAGRRPARGGPEMGEASTEAPEPRLLTDAAPRA